MSQTIIIPSSRKMRKRRKMMEEKRKWLLLKSGKKSITSDLELERLLKTRNQLEIFLI
jgi:hypothetical protein